MGSVGELALLFDSCLFEELPQGFRWEGSMLRKRGGEMCVQQKYLMGQHVVSDFPTDDLSLELNSPLPDCSQRHLAFDSYIAVSLGTNTLRECLKTKVTAGAGEMAQ